MRVNCTFTQNIKESLYMGDFIWASASVYFLSNITHGFSKFTQPLSKLYIYS